MSSLDKVCAELEEIGYVPQVLQFQKSQRKVAVVEYEVLTGRFRGRTMKVGIAFQEEGYPEYPPHFLYIESIDCPELREHSKDFHGETEWTVFSVPPKDFWDHIPQPEKNMKTYFNMHLIRIWDQI